MKIQNSKIINADKIKHFIAKNNFSWHRFAIACHITKRTLVKILNQESGFMFESLLKISEFMKVPVKELFV